MWNREDEDPPPNFSSQEFKVPNFKRPVRKKINSGMMMNSSNPKFADKNAQFQRGRSGSGSTGIGLPPGTMPSPKATNAQRLGGRPQNTTDRRGSDLERKVKERGLELTFDPTTSKELTSDWGRSGGHRASPDVRLFSASADNPGKLSRDPSFAGSTADPPGAGLPGDGKPGGGRGGSPVVVDDMKRFVSAPCGQSPHQFRIFRITSGIKNKIFPKYEMVLEDGERFVLAAKKRKKNKTSNYLIGLDQDVHKGTDKLVGKVRSNLMGTEFTCFDNGCNPTKAKYTNKEGRCELASVRFARDIAGKGPRRMTVTVPTRKDSGDLSVFQPSGEGLDGLSQASKDKSEEVVDLLNKPPSWDANRNCYSINFGGRVTCGSVKNFQLVTSDDPDTVVLQFGKVAKNQFTCDVRWPLSPLQALSIVLTSFDIKLGAQ